MKRLNKKWLAGLMILIVSALLLCVTASAEEPMIGIQLYGPDRDYQAGETIEFRYELTNQGWGLPDRVTFRSACTIEGTSDFGYLDEQLYGWNGTINVRIPKMANAVAFLIEYYYEAYDYGGIAYSRDIPVYGAKPLTITLNFDPVTPYAGYGLDTGYTISGGSGSGYSIVDAWWNISDDYGNSAVYSLKTDRISGKTGTLHTEPLPTWAQYGDFCVTIEDAGESFTYSVTKSFFKEIKPYQPADVTSQPVSKIVNEGSDAMFSVGAVGYGLKYQWQYRASPAGTWSNTTATGSTTATVTIPATESRDGYQYRCVVTDRFGVKAYSDPATLTVKMNLEILGQPINKTVAEGTNAKFTVTARGNGLVYQWEYRPNAATDWAITTATGYDTATLTVPATASRNDYQYRCWIHDQYGYVICSNIVTLKVQVDINITSQPANISVYENNDASFSVTATGLNIKYQWQYRASSTGTWANTSATGATTRRLTVEATTAKNGYQYRCKITDSNGQQAFSSAATLTVKTILRITGQPAAKSVAEGTNAQFKVTAVGDGLKYQWQYRASSSGTWDRTSATGATTATLTVETTPAKSGYQYRCVVTDKYGNSLNSNAATLTVKANLKIINQPVSKTVDENNIAKFTVTASGDGLKYQWQYRPSSTDAWSNTSATGATTSALSIEATIVKRGYQYRCVITDQYGRSVTSTAGTLTIRAQLKITAQPTTKTVEEGTTAKFSVVAAGDGLTYQWQYRASSSGTWDNTSATGATTATLNIPAETFRNGYQYRCVVSDKYGSKLNSSVATLTVKAILKITAQPTGKTVTEGSTAKFSVTAAGDGLRYQWQYRASSTGTWANTSASGATTATLTIDATLAKKGYQYRCIVTDQYGKTLNSNAATLTVKAVLKITTQPTSKTTNEGANVKFTVIAAGDGVKYQWQYRASSTGTWANTSATGATTATLTVEATKAKTGYQYRCMVSDTYGKTVNSSVATLTVRAILKITSQPTGKTVTEGASAKFTVAAAGDGLKYQWQYRASSSGTWANTSATGATSATLTVDATVAKKGYQYRCVVTDQYGNTLNSNAATLTVKTVLRITTQPTGKTVNEGTNVKFTVTAAGDGVKYQWQYRASSTGTWANTSATGATTAALTVEATKAKTGYQYRCVVSDTYGNTVNSSAVTLTVKAILKITAQPASKTVTEGASAKFTVTAAGDGVKYQWQYRASSSGTWANTSATGATSAALTVDATASKKGYQYRCVVTDKYGNTLNSNAATLTVKTVLKITAQPTGKTVNEGTNAKFTVTAAGDGLKYQWQYRASSTGTWANTSATGATTATLTVEAALSKRGYQYRCNVTDQYGSSVSSTAATLTVKAVLKITAQPAGKTVNTGASASFTVSASGDGVKYQWQYRASSTGTWANTSATGATTATVTVDATASKTGYQYRCVLTDTYGQTVNSSAATLTVKTPLKITAQPTGKTVNEGTNAVFTVTATGDGLKYQWQYRTSSTGTWANTSATGATTASLTVEATLAKKGYQYRCNITDKYGSSVASSAATLTVKAVLKITTQPANKSVASGTNAKFTVTASGDGVKYQWQYRASSTGTWANTSATGATTATLTVEAASGKNGYQYRCVLTDNYGKTVNSAAATLTVKTQLQITTQPTSKGVASGSNAVFTVKAVGDGLKYQWQYRASSTGTWSNTSATGSTTASLTIPATASRNGYQYRCVITDKYGSGLNSNAATLTVK